MDICRDIFAELAPEIPTDEIHADATFEELELDPVTRFAFIVQLERALKIEIPDERARQAVALKDCAPTEVEAQSG